MSGGGGQNTNTIQNADPWKGVQPYLAGGRASFVPHGPMGPGGPSFGGGTPTPGGGIPSGPSFGMEPPFSGLTGEPFLNALETIATPDPRSYDPEYGTYAGSFGDTSPILDVVRSLREHGQAAGGTQVPGLFQLAHENLMRPESTVAGFDPFQTASQNAIAERAMAGSPLLRAAQQYQGDVLGGDYLSQGNPHTAALTDSIRAQVMPAVGGQFEAGGRFGSPAHAGTMTREMTRALAPFMFQNYQQERGFQEAAAGRAPQLAASDYVDLMQLGSVGAQRQALEQAKLDEPSRRLAAYQALLGGSFGGQTASSQSGSGPGLGPLQVAQGLAGTAAAAGLAYSLFSTPEAAAALALV